MFNWCTELSCYLFSSELACICIYISVANALREQQTFKWNFWFQFFFKDKKLNCFYHNHWAQEWNVQKRSETFEMCCKTLKNENCPKKQQKTGRNKKVFEIFILFYLIFYFFCSPFRFLFLCRNQTKAYLTNS